MANPNPKTGHLKDTQWKSGQSGNPKGHPQGLPNRKTILEYFLFEASADELGGMAGKPKWFGQVKPRTVYEAMTAAQAIKSIQGDTFAFNALNRALGPDEPASMAPNPIQFVCGVPVSELSNDELEAKVEELRKATDKGSKASSGRKF